MKLIDLWSESERMPAAEGQRYVLSELPQRATKIGLHMWKLGDPIENRGKRMLVGISTYVKEEIEFLDALNGLSRPMQLDVFMFADCQSQSDIEHYVPNIPPVTSSPVVGVWEDGILVIKVSGWQAKQFLTKELAV